jgi:squalene-hopene/tetraprenyl-beta-curcumene cyclase
MSILRWTALTLALALCGLLSAGTAAEPAPRAEAAKQWDDAVSKAVAYLKANQGADGSWGGKQAPGVTGLAVYGMLRSGKVTARDPAVEKGLKYIESLVDRKKGHIAGKDPHLKVQNYVTSINVLALSAADPEGYKAVIDAATTFLRELQWDEGEGKTPKDDFYGGAGYDSRSRPDLSNTQFFLDALVAGRVPKTDPAFRKAAIFVSRCQNFKSEHNDQPWADKINDGSFIYSAAGGGQSKTVDEPGPDGKLPGYGSMTFAGVKSLLQCGVARDDKRIAKALEWIRKNYTLDQNPGMPKDRALWGLYYYYLSMAKCLDLLGDAELQDAAGKKHDWRAEITAALAKRQRPDGSWINESDHWLEGDPQVVTSYALMTLAYCKLQK